MSDQILVFINGESFKVPDKLSITALLSHLNIEGRLVVDLNGEIIPRSQHAQTQVNAGDKLEIVHAIGGGSGQRS